MKHLRVLLINPHIYDFAAYNFWSSPLGLLYTGAVLRQNGAEVTLIDCMRSQEEKRKPDGRAPFVKEKSRGPLPAPLAGIKKRLKRYGISPVRLREELALLEPPDLVLITSIMTYWYMGAHETARVAREAYPHARIVMGGIYPSLCIEHAQAHKGDADLVLSHRQMDILYRYVEESFHYPLPFRPSLYDLDALPYPAFDLYDSLPFVPLLTSYGCAFHCAYCATPFMHPRMARRSPASTLYEVRHWQEQGVSRFVLYDDSFLYQSDAFAKPLLRELSRLPSPINLYNPNAVNAAFMDEELADLLSLAGFEEVRFGLETVDPALQRTTGGKVTTRVFERALRSLKAAAFPLERVAAYILSGLPFQKWQDVKASIDYLAGLGVRAHIAEYTPIPHTPLYEQYASHARYPLDEDPIYQNNALFPFAWEGFTEEDLAYLKTYLAETYAAASRA
ncbi:MAG TPA: radical SAM protein [Syntrophorhabdaceae bacterium]